MRRIEPEKKKKDYKAKIYVGIIGFFMLFSFIGLTVSTLTFHLGLGGDDQNLGELEYSGREFIPTQTGLATILDDDQVVQFNYYPEDVRDIEIDLTLSRALTGPYAQYTSDVDSNMAPIIAAVQFDLSRNSEREHQTFTQIGFTGENEFNIPVITCEDATADTPVVYLNFTNSTTDITTSNNCVTVNFANDFALARFRDKFVYEILEVQ